MVPNKELCTQVFKMASEVCDALRRTGGRIVTVEALSSFNGIWPYAYSGAIGNVSSAPLPISETSSKARTLLKSVYSGTYAVWFWMKQTWSSKGLTKDVEKIMDVFKVVRRRMIREGEVQINTDTLQNVRDGNFAIIWIKIHREIHSKALSSCN